MEAKVPRLVGLIIFHLDLCLLMLYGFPFTSSWKLNWKNPFLVQGSLFGEETNLQILCQTHAGL